MAKTIVPPKIEGMQNPTRLISLAATKSVIDLVEGIDCATHTLRDLIGLAKQECVQLGINANKAANVISAAARYVDDIDALCHKIYDIDSQLKPRD